MRKENKEYEVKKTQTAQEREGAKGGGGRGGWVGVELASKMEAPGI